MKNRLYWRYSIKENHLFFFKLSELFFLNFDVPEDECLNP
jgi:hypothetical protein